MKTFKAVMLVGLLLVGSGKGWGQDSLGISLVESAFETWGSCIDLAARDGVIYLATTTGLKRVERDQTELIALNNYNHCRPIRLFLMEEQIALICEESGLSLIGWEDSSLYELVIVDLDDPSQIVSRTNLNALNLHPQLYSGTLLEGNLLYFSDTPSLAFPDRFDIAALDLSDPENPELSFRINLQDPDDLPVDFKIYDGRLFAQLADQVGKLDVYNLENHQREHRLDFEYIRAFDIQDDILAVSLYENRDQIITFYEMSDLENIREVARYSEEGPWYPFGLKFDGEKLYVRDSFQISTLDVSDLGNIAPLSYSPLIEGIGRCLFQQDTVFALFYSAFSDRPNCGCLLLEADNERQMRPLAWHFPTPSLNDLIVQENRLMAFEGPGGGSWDSPDLSVRPTGRLIDIENPHSIVSVGNIPLSIMRSQRSITIRDTILYYSFDEANQIQIYDIRRPDRTPNIGRFGANWVSRLGIFENFLYAPDQGRRSIHVYNINNLTEPQARDTIRLDHSWGDFFCNNNLMFIRLQNTAWEINQIVDSTEIRYLSMVGDAWDEAQVSGNLLFLMNHMSENDNSWRLGVYDISNPARPQEVSSLDSSWQTGYLGIPSGSFVPIIIREFVDNRNLYRLDLIDVTDPANPELAGFYQSPDIMIDAALYGSALYIAYNNRLVLYNCANIMGINESPHWRNPSEHVTVYETERLVLNLTAVDLNGDELTLTMLPHNLPEEAIFQDHGEGAGTFDWSPDVNSAGEYRPEFVCSDGELTDTMIVVITVSNFNANPPTFRDFPDSVAVSENEIIQFSLQASDQDGDSLTLTALDLPEGSVFNDQSGGQGNFRWSPNFTSAGEYFPRFIASDGELTDTCTVVITVINVNRPPALTHLLTPPDLTGDHERQYWEDSRLRFRWASASDPDDDNLRYHLKLVATQYGFEDARFDSICVDAGSDTSCLIDGDQILELLDSGWELLWSVWTLDGIDSIPSEEVFRYVHYSSVNDSSFQLSTFNLQLFPNPFNSSTTISFSLPSSSSSSLRVYGLDGRLVRELWTGGDAHPTSERQAGRLSYAGEHKVVWDASSLSAGVYLIRLESSSHTATQKVVLMK